MPFAKVEDMLEAELISLMKDEALYSEKFHEIAAKITAPKADSYAQLRRITGSTALN
jgi:hypothetical protein